MMTNYVDSTARRSLAGLSLAAVAALCLIAAPSALGHAGASHSTRADGVTGTTAPAPAASPNDLGWG